MKKSNRTSTKDIAKNEGKAAVTVTSIQVEWLLEAVKRVKAQKQRPDRERICHYIQQHHDLTSETVSLLLDSAVKSNILTTTITRGNTDKLTYVITTPSTPLPPTAPPKPAEPVPADASNTNSKTETNSKNILLHNKSDISPLMVKAVKALRESSGSSLNDIAEYILTSCNVELKNGVDLIRLVKLSARQAVRNDMLMKNKDNLYKIPRGQRGRPKNDSPPAKTTKPPAKAKPIPICCFCLGDEKKNRSKQPEEMVSCCRCGQSGHPSCLKFSESQTKVVLGMDDWECYDCKKCAVCKVSRRNDNDMLICDRCDRSFHPHCCRPPVKKPPDGTWICHLCINGHDGKWKTLPSDNKEDVKKDITSPSTSNGKMKYGLIRKRYEYKSRCVTQGCDGSGNSNPIMSNHRRQTACPLLSKQERRKFRQQKGSGSDSDDDSKPSSVASTNGSSLVEPPLPEGLKDGLSQFFTPTDKRTSRVSMSSLLTAAAATAQPVKQPKSAATTSQAAASKILKKSKLVQQTKAKAIQKALNNNNNKTENQHGSSASSSTTFSISEHIHGLPGQLKGLVDGMTRFFTPTGERKRTMPLYAAPIRKRKDTDKSGGATRSGGEESDGLGLLSDGGEKSDGNIVDSIDKTHLPEGVSIRDYRLFRKSQEEAEEPGSVGLLVKPVIEQGKRYPPTIEFGKYELQTWYSSPYPQEYAQLPKLYICEFCLKYMKSKSILSRHMNKCGLTNPPANEIYCKDNLSVFEVDGNTNKIYCQNLCLLAKLFLDHKTLYYDVEPFLFYVLTSNDSDGCHFVGYFSKEKHCQQKYNVSCITTLPQHQRKGYGKFLIDFSYLLSRIEGVPGSPEKPLSELGKITYRSYWKCALLRYLHHHKDDSSLTIKSISTDTGMCPHDIASTLQDLHMIDTNTADDVIISLNNEAITSHMTRLESVVSARLVIDEECVRWTPVISSHSLSSPEKSSSPDKASVVSLLRERRLTVDAEIEVEPEPVKSPPPRKRRVSLTKDRRRQTAHNSASARSTSPPASAIATGESKCSTTVASPPNDCLSSKLRSRVSPLRSSAVNSARSPTGKVTSSNGPTLTNGILPASSRRRRSQVSSSDEEGNVAVKSKPHPPKKRRASCKEDKISRRKSGSPSTPEKKNRYSSTRSSSARRVSRTSRQQTAACNSQHTKSSSSADDRRHGKTANNGGPSDTYLSDGASSVYSGGAACYDASASDTDSGNSEMELSSNASAVWSPTMQPVYSDSGCVTEGRSSRLDQFLQDSEQQPTPLKEELSASTVIPHKPAREHLVSTLSEDMRAKDPSHHSQSVCKTDTVKSQLPVPQSYPPNTAPEIDPASLCFESPISLSSNDTSLNGSQPIESTPQYGDQSLTPITDSTQTYNSYSDYTNAVHSSSINNLQCGQQQCGGLSTQQQSGIDSFMDGIPSISTEQGAQCEYQTQQLQNCYSNVSAAMDHQHPSPQNLQHAAAPMFPPQSPLTLIPNSPHLAPQSPQVPQKSPLIHPKSPHIPPQSPHIHPQSPCIHPQSPHIHPQSPHMPPQSPHIPPQSPHFSHSGPILSPGHQQTPYNYRGRTGSMSKTTPPDLTPPPGTPSPSKQHSSPDRYQQYLQQSRVPQKSPNITISGRDLQQQYGSSSCALPSTPIHQHMQNLNNNPGAYQAHHHQQPVNTQHFFPANQYMDPRYFNHFNPMQLAQAAAAQPTSMYGSQIPAANTAGMYGYH